jgi:hypothetical protein
MAVGGDAVLRMLRRGPEASPRPRVLGVNDWAWRRGRRYGSVLVDLEAGRPVDLLPDCSAASLATWLKEHPGVEVIVRDRSTEYARGATIGAPDALQVVDRWHVLRNVREVAERLLERLRLDAPGPCQHATDRVASPAAGRGGTTSDRPPPRRRVPCRGPAPGRRRRDHLGDRPAAESAGRSSAQHTDAWSGRGNG